jgi:hypothetical protein
MGKMSKLIALVIFSCFGVSYGAEYDIKMITIIMDAYEKQIDSIKLKYSYERFLDKEGNREFVRGTFAQKLSEGYVLLDERSQKGRTWDEDRDTIGIARSYNGKITRYLEHEKTKHGYQQAALYENHNPKLYESGENPYYRFYRVNHAAKLTDLLNDPNAMVNIQGEELVDGFRTIKISLKKKASLFQRYVWLLPEKNYLPIKYKIVRTADGSNYWQINWSEFKEFAGDIWFPGRMELYFGDINEPTTLKVEEMDISPLTKEDFEFTFPAFTHVTDHIAGTSYLTTIPMEQSGIEQTPLESSLSNKEKEKVLDKYLESSETTNIKDSDAIDADVKPGSKANLKEKSAGVSYWIILLVSILIVPGIICVFTRRQKA